MTDDADLTVAYAEGRKDEREAMQPVVDELVAALKRMLDAFYEDPMDADQSGASDAAYAAIDRAEGVTE